jgi:hypothetical protein
VITVTGLTKEVASRQLSSILVVQTVALAIAILAIRERRLASARPVGD